MLIDSHAHLMDEMFREDLQTVINRCIENKITNVVNIGYSKETSLQAIELANEYDWMYAVIGLHPDECNQPTEIDFLKELAKEPKVVAIGEIGLDYHYDTTNKENQAKYFVEQIKLANELELPIVIHSRDADMDMLKILKENYIKCGFVMHCFSSSVEVAKEVLKLGGYISLAGTVTFKNARNLLEVAKMVPEDKLLVETDCPYLSPEPNRGKRNEPSNVLYTARKIAEIRGESFEKIAEITTRNAKEFYGISNLLS